MVACLMTLVMTGMLAACGNSAGEKQPVQDNSSAGTTEEMQAPAETGNAGGDTIVLKLGHIQSESDLWHLGAQKFADTVSELSGGEIKVDIYPNSTLGGDRDMAEGMMMGTVDIALIAGVLSNFDDSISILEIPYLFRSDEEFETIVYGEVGQEIADHVLSSSGDQCHGKGIQCMGSCCDHNELVRGVSGTAAGCNRSTGESDSVLLFRFDL